jgi:hypothetical protein
MNDLKYHACALVAALDDALVGALALDNARARDLARARKLVFALNHAFDLERVLAPDLDFALALALDLERVLKPRPRPQQRALERVLNRDRVLNSAPDRNSALDLARRLARDIDLARREGAPAGLRRVRPGQVAPSAGRLLAAAARLLPRADRGRYTEEFQSELSDLVAAGAGRRAQLAYAARLLAAARSLRVELRAPRRERAAP